MTENSYKVWSLIFQFFTAIGTVGATCFAAWSIYKKEKPHLDVVLDGHYDHDEDCYKYFIYAMNTGGGPESIYSFGIEAGFVFKKRKTFHTSQFCGEKICFPMTIQPGEVGGFEILPIEFSRICHDAIIELRWKYFILPTKIRIFVNKLLTPERVIHSVKCCAYSTRGGVAATYLDCDLKKDVLKLFEIERAMIQTLKEPK
ncbi:MAG: hypothetical protein AB7E51_08525 [Pseudodesulfovibrio sp.]|uniref:hypothetical protein n=1 Tax=Pseudodesulfovibrio sp. TaxID=2035812 RepID=UPI003D119210